MNLIFYAAFLCKALSSTPAIALLFVSIERCLMMIYKNDYRCFWSKCLSCCSIVSTVLCFTIISSLSIIYKKLERNVTCISMHCFISSIARTVHAIFTMSIGILIIGTLITYIIAKVRYNNYRRTLPIPSNNVKLKVSIFLRVSVRKSWSYPDYFTLDRVAHLTSKFTTERP